MAEQTRPLAQHEIDRQAMAFLSHVFSELERQGLELEAHWDLDHLCYRTETLERYHLLKNEFMGFADLLIESQVNGRPIATFKLHQPYLFRGRTIDLLELPAPKAGKRTREGFEHIEVVCDRSFSELKTWLSAYGVNDGGLSKDFNQELEIEFDGFAVKFHHLSLASVVTLEGQTAVWRAIEASRVLQVLKTYRPLLAGTFPLGVDEKGSDVDVLLTAENLAELASVIETHYSREPGFRFEQIEVKGVASLLAGFDMAGVEFELFAQPLESVRQTAYRHFQIEERLLKLGGARLRRRIRDLRAEGLKTEPAFARALDLEGDPYEALLKLHRASETELRKLLLRFAPGQ